MRRENKFNYFIYIFRCFVLLLLIQLFLNKYNTIVSADRKLFFFQSVFFECITEEYDTLRKKYYYSRIKTTFFDVITIFKYSNAIRYRIEIQKQVNQLRSIILYCREYMISVFCLSKHIINQVICFAISVIKINIILRNA